MPDSGLDSNLKLRSAGVDQLLDHCGAVAREGDPVLYGDVEQVCRTLQIVKAKQLLDIVEQRFLYSPKQTRALLESAKNHLEKGSPL